MAIDYAKAKLTFQAALRELATDQNTVADLAGMHFVTVSRLVNGVLAGQRNEQKLLIQVCRQGLMVQAALLGRNDEEMLKYTEREIFGLAEADPHILITDARQLARQRRAEMHGVTT